MRTEIGSLLLSQMQAENIRMDLRVADGQLDVAPMRLDIAEGSLEGELAFRALKGRDLVKTSASDGGIWKIFSEGIRDLSVEDGRMRIELKE